MQTLGDISTALIAIISTGVVTRFIFLCVTYTSSDDKEHIVSQLKSLVWVLVVTINITLIRTIVDLYYK